MRVVVIGDSGVGKTSFIRHLTNTHTYECQSTIGADTIRMHYKGKKIDLWDTAGQEAYRSLIKMYVRGASVAILMFDLNKISTFKSLDYWWNHVKNSNVLCKYVVVGNKSDKMRDTMIYDM
uniref:Ras family protein n=1 Tax=Megaviridae environmental sample TaxID=1737588 RepID=A0A5J6VIU3_9VIRU|nr:MAG: Ras family protein [Megaviridae environmental sample]